MASLSSSKRSPLVFVLFYFVLWIILFEFILPVNNILPKPSIVFQSFGALWEDYNLPFNFLDTVAAIYLSIIVAYLLVHFLSHFFVTNRNFLTDFIFAFSTSYLSLIIFLQKRIENLPAEYTDAARSLGISEKRIRKEIVWKSIQPEIFNHIYELHLYIWSLLIAFEFIKGNYGLGNIFRLALQYKDLSALFSTFIIVGVTIFLGKTVISYLNKKFAFWSL